MGEKMTYQYEGLTEEESEVICKEVFDAINDLDIPWRDKLHLMVNVFLNFFANHKIKIVDMDNLLIEMGEKYREQNEPKLP